MIRIIESIENKNDKLVIDVNDSEKQLKDLVDYIKEVSDAGHSFDVVVDPGNEDWEKGFEIDGDGAFSIKEVKFEKDDDKKDIEKKEESIRSINNFKKEYNVSDEDISTLKHYYENPWNEYKDLSFVDYLYDLVDNNLLPEMLSESKNVKKESVQSEDDFVLALADVLKSMKVLNELWHQWDVTAECLNNEKYPFNKSFDEVCEDVNIWLEETKKISLND